MKKLLVNGVQHQAEKIIKTSNDIIGQDSNGNRLFAFQGISDFTQFQLEEGQEWDTSPEDNEMMYLLDLDYRLSLIELGI